MKIKLIPEKCIACGICHIHAPEIFDYTDEGIVTFYKTDELEEHFPTDNKTISAVKSCPVGALQITERD
ncbi:MAG: ferredoxin [Streptococcaceae bacterium]|nr:ferredoxin [Streptococcaceae bacterium]